MKKLVKIIKYFIISSLFLVPLIKLFLDITFGITLISTFKVIATYIALYSIIAILAALIIRKASFCLAMVIFFYIYAFSLFLSNGLDSGLKAVNEFKSPNNKNILIIDSRVTWYPSGYMKFYRKLNSFLVKTIRTPKLKWATEANRVSHALEWKDDNTVIIAGPIVKYNLHRFTTAKETLPDKYNFEIIDKKLYLKLK